MCRDKGEGQGVIIKTVIWDMDGTIADSAALHFRAWQATMQRYGVDYPYQLLSLIHISQPTSPK